MGLSPQNGVYRPPLGKPAIEQFLDESNKFLTHVIRMLGQGFGRDASSGQPLAKQFAGLEEPGAVRLREPPFQERLVAEGPALFGITYRSARPQALLPMLRTAK